MVRKKQDHPELLKTLALEKIDYYNNSVHIYTDNNNNNSVSLMQLQTNAAKDTYNICHAGQYAHTVQHGM